MGLFRSTKEAAQEKAFNEATDWFKKQAETAEAFNEEDGKLGGARHTEASTHLHSHRGRWGERHGRSIGQVEQPKGDARRILQAGTAGANLCKPHPGDSSKAGHRGWHQERRTPVGSTKTGITTHNQYFVAA